MCSRAVDKSGNISEWLASSGTITDTLAPEAITGFTTPSNSASNTVSISWTESPELNEYLIKYCAVSGCESSCSDEETVTSSPADLTMSDGSYFICSAGKDRAGNISPWTQSSQILVDTTGPTNPSAISITSDNPTNGSTVSFTYTAGFDVNFSTNRVKACTDSDCSTSCVDEHADTMSPETISGLAANTPYYICVRTEDSAATTSAWVASAGTIVTDTIAPSDASAVTITSTIPLNADSLDASYTSGDGSTHNVKACIDTSCSTNCVGSNTDIASPVTISGLQDGVPYYACIQSVDAATNTANWVASGSTVTPDLTPNVTSVSSADANAYYKAGDTITITVQFDMAVTVVNNGDITLALETGTTDRNATYSSGSGTDTLSFSYSVQADDENNDLDYLSTTALAVNTSTIQGPTGINAVLTLAAPELLTL